MAGVKGTLAKLAQLRSRFEKNIRSEAWRSASEALGTDRLSEITGFGSNPGNLRMLAYAPRNLRPDSPLVIALHGCTQTASAYDYGSGWSTLADRYGFALLCPEQQHANNPNLCFNWFQSGDTTRDRGEALSIRQMIERSIRQHASDRDRVYIVGLSAGGAMAAAMLASYPEVFAGGAIVAGLPYGTAATVQSAFEVMAQSSGRSPQELGNLVRSASPHRGQWPRLSVWHGSADAIVSPANAEEILAQWINVHGLPAEADFEEHGRDYSRRVWRDEAGANLIEAHLIPGMGHGVPLALTGGKEQCGNPAPFHFEVGLSSSAQIITFWGIAEGASTAKSAAAADTSHWKSIAPASARVGAETIPALPFPAPLSAAVSVRLAQPAGADEDFSNVARAPFDARDVITATLQRAGLLVPNASEPGSDPRSIISRTLRSVGLLKD